MKPLKILLLFVLFNCAAHAQILIEEPFLKELKATTTYFVHRASDDPEVYKQIFKENWHLTEVQVISWDEFKDRKPKKDESYIYISSHTDIVNNTVKSHLYLAIDLLKKGAEKPINLATSYLQGDFNTIKEVESITLSRQPDSYAKFMEFTCNSSSAVFYNWGPGQIKNILQYWEREISKGKPREYKEAFFNTPAMKPLATETLYIPDFLLIRMSATSGDESGRWTPEELMANYPYPYKFVSSEALSELILTSETPIYYLSANRDVATINMSVRNSETGEELGFYDVNNSYKLNPKDFKKLQSTIAKALK